MATNYTQNAACEAAYLFDGSFNDISAIGTNHLTQNGTVTLSTTKPTGHTRGNSVLFDGSTNFLYRTYANQSNNFPGKVTMQDCTVAFWFRPTTLLNTVYMLTCGSMTRIYSDYSGGTGKGIGHAQYDSGFTSGAWEYINNTISANTWYHIVLKSDGDGANSVVTAWISTESAFGDIVNNLQNSNNYAGVGDVGGGSSSNFVLGAKHDGTAFWAGYIYQPIVFENFLISNAEAAELWQYGIDGNDGAGGATLEQEGFRFRNDDGDEANATWAEAQDANMQAPKNVNRRIRFIINATGDPSNKSFQLEYKKSTDSVYRKVT